MAELNCTRTISTTPEVALSPEIFCQPIDIGVDLRGNTTQDISDMDGYPLRSLQNAIEYIGQLLEVGVRKVMIRMDAPPKYTDKHRLLERQALIVRTLRAAYDQKTLQLIVDPFSVALNVDKTWGIKVKDQLDYMQTAEFFSLVTQHFAEVGADYILTLGRFEHEVDIAARTIQSQGSSMRVSSFSTNTETTNAYVYASHQLYAVTGQKILVSNYNEMVFRALLDIHEGSHLIVVKPAENLHVLEKIVTLLSNTALLKQFLESDQVVSLVTRASYLKTSYQDILSDLEIFADKARSVGVGSYTVSGTYYIDRQTLRRKGDNFLASLLYERYANAAAVMAPHGECVIIDRNAGWFWINQRRVNG